LPHLQKNIKKTQLLTEMHHLSLIIRKEAVKIISIKLTAISDNIGLYLHAYLMDEIVSQTP